MQSITRYPILIKYGKGCLFTNIAQYMQAELLVPPCGPTSMIPTSWSVIVTAVTFTLVLLPQHGNLHLCFVPVADRNGNFGGCDVDVDRNYHLFTAEIIDPFAVPGQVVGQRNFSDSLFFRSQGHPHLVLPSETEYVEYAFHRSRFVL